MRTTTDYYAYRAAQQKAVRESDQPTYTWAEIGRRGLHPWCHGGRPERCSCGHGSWRIFEHVIASGAVQLRFGCARCGLDATGGTSMPFAGINREHVVKPDIFYQHATARPCERCKSNGGTERHHWAPSAIFGMDAHNWPVGYLCRKCHREWHAKMNEWRKNLRAEPAGDTIAAAFRLPTGDPP